jgi:hypothetical protein
MTLAICIVLALQLDRFDDLRQQLPGAAHERKPLFVLVGARRFADEHQVSLRAADAEHDLLPSERVQLAARAVAEIGANGDERPRGC